MEDKIQDPHPANDEYLGDENLHKAGSHPDSLTSMFM